MKSKIVKITGIAAAAALLAGGVTACTSGTAGNSSDSAAANAVTTLDFWGWVPGLEDLVTEWNTNNPDIQVTFHRMTGDDGTKVEAAVDAGAGPDIVQVSTHDLPSYIISGRVQDITAYVSDTESNFTPSSWASVTFNDAVYGVPQGVGPAATMYREDILAKYDIAVPTTWDEYLEAARKLHAANPKLYIANLSSSEIGQWMQEVQQAEGSWYGIDGDAWTVGVNDSASQQVAQRWQTLLDEHLVTTEQMWTPAYWSLVNKGTIATITYAAWFPVSLETNAPDTTGLWRVASMPKNTGSTYAGDSGGAADVVLKGAKNPEAAAKFISWLNGSDDTQEALITVGGLFPSTNSGLASSSLVQPVDFFGGHSINEVFVDAANNTPSTWVDGPNYNIAKTAVTDEFAKVIEGTETFAQALDNAQEATVSDLEAQGLSVSSSGE